MKKQNQTPLASGSKLLKNIKTNETKKKPNKWESKKKAKKTPPYI